MADDKEIFKRSRFFFSVLFVLSFVLVFSNVLNLRSNYPVFLINPIHDLAFRSAESVNNFFSVFGEMNTLRGEYYDLKEEYLVLKGESKSIPLLYQENAILKEQLSVEEEQEDLLLAQILHQDMDSRMETLVLNKGEEDGVRVGDVAVIGDIYVGIVIEATPKTSKVRLPTSRANSLKVMILIDEENGDYDSAFSNGMAVGYANRVRIDNVELDDNLQEGDAIFINDPKVGGFLYLGDVLALDDDPTKTSQSGDVRLPVNYQGLKFVFIKGR